MPFHVANLHNYNNSLTHRDIFIKTYQKKVYRLQLLVKLAMGKYQDDSFFWYVMVGRLTGRIMKTFRFPFRSGYMEELIGNGT